jgi:hypothetical protein
MGNPVRARGCYQSFELTSIFASLYDFLQSPLYAPSHIWARRGREQIEILHYHLAGRLRLLLTLRQAGLTRAGDLPRVCAVDHHRAVEVGPPFRPQAPPSRDGWRRFRLFRENRRRRGRIGHLRVLSRKLERAYPLPGFVYHPQPPFGAVPEPAADIPQQFARSDDCLDARFIRAGEFGSFIVE